MDLSKLPKMSQTPATPVDPLPAADRSPPLPTSPATVPPQAAPIYSPGIGAEAWISIGIGLLILLLTPTTIRYFSSRVLHTSFAPFPDPTRPFPAKCDFILYTDGTKVFYRDLQQFWSDLVITSFALALILDGVVIAWMRKPVPMLIALGVTVVATLANLIYLVKTFDSGIAVWSAVAVILGVYTAIYQWGLYQALTHRHPVNA